MAVTRKEGAPIPGKAVVEPEKPSLPQTESTDAIGLYLEEIGQIPLLTPKEEIEAATRIALGRNAQKELSQNESLTEKEKEDLKRQVEKGKEAKETLTNANLRLVVSIAKGHQGRGLSFLDLIQEGNTGLIKAVEKFDPKKINPETGRPHRFSTYATWWIRQAVTRAIANQGRTIRLPDHVINKINHLRQTERNLAQELDREPTVKELAERLEISPKGVSQLLKTSQRTLSLNTPVGRDKGTKEAETLGYFIEDKEAPNPSEFATKQLLRKQAQKVLRSLRRLEAKVLELRFGLVDGHERTLEEVGQELGLTREGARQIEKKALKKLRHPLRLRELEGYLE